MVTLLKYRLSSWADTYLCFQVLEQDSRLYRSQHRYVAPGYEISVFSQGYPEISSSSYDGIIYLQIFLRGTNKSEHFKVDTYRFFNGELLSMIPFINNALKLYVDRSISELTGLFFMGDGTYEIRTLE